MDSRKEGASAASDRSPSVAMTPEQRITPVPSASPPDHNGTPYPPTAYGKDSGAGQLYPSLPTDGAISAPPPYSPGPGGAMAAPGDEIRAESCIQPVPFAPPSHDAAREAAKAQAVVQKHFVMADFWPSCVERGISMQGRLPVFQPFSFVMQCANSFLAYNPKLRVYRCETLECSTDFHGRFDPSKNVDLESAEGWRIFVRGLRLWCIDCPDEAPQQVWYLNLMPETGKLDSLGMPSCYEGITRTMERLNSYLVTAPIPGTVVTIDSVNLRLTSGIRGPVDLDRSCRGAASGDTQSLLTCFRIFYVLGPPSGERLGIVKFVPDAVVRGSKVRWMELDQLMLKATSWALNPSLRVTNFQTVRTPAKIRTAQGNALDVKVPVDDTHLVIASNSSIAFCLTAGFTFRPDGGPCRTAFPSGTLTTRTFLPSKLGGRSYESVQDTLRRISAYLHLSESKVVFAETIAIPHNPQFEVIHHEKLSYDMVRGKGQYYVYIYRLYFDGVCREVDPALLPRSQRNSQACAIL